MSAIRALLDGLIDYAGFAPPAALPMAKAVRSYAAYREGPHGWALGRFITPVARLAEFQEAAREIAPFSLSILLPLQTPMPAAGSHSIEAIEVKAESATDIADTMRMVPAGIVAYFEVTANGNYDDMLQVMKETGARAKVRTGGLSADMFPTPAELVRFMASCVRAGVAFKATAGLHHAVRAIHRLTYEPASPATMMHGFLNVYLAATLLYSGGSEADATRTLEEQSPKAFQFSETGVSWHGHHLSTNDITRARLNFAISFGSCSFEEPVADLQALGIL